MSKKILFTFVGGSDPIRNDYDGPMLHICRYYKPEKVYIMLTSEMEELDKKDNRYELALTKHLDYVPQVYKITTGIVKAHEFDVYFDDIKSTFERIRKENPDAEILANITSGTAQGIANITNFILDAPYQILPIQVSTPQNKSNDSLDKRENFDEKVDKENNFDNHPEYRTNRTLIPNLNRYKKMFEKPRIVGLIEKYDYHTALKILQANLFKNPNIKSLIEYASERKELKKLDANKKLSVIEEKKYKKYNYDKEKSTELWYQLTDYFALAGTKLDSKDISGYVLMLEPTMANLQQSILEDLIQIPMEKYFTLNRKSQSYLVDWQKIDKNSSLSMTLQKKFKKSNEEKYVSNNFLEETIRFFVRQKEKDYYFDFKDFKRLCDILKAMKPIRNHLAHKLFAITAEDFKRVTGEDLYQIHKDIIQFFKKYYSTLGYKEDMLNFYNNLNHEILRLLNEEN